MFQKAVFFDYHETEKGAWFKVHVPGWFPNKAIIKEWMNGIIRIDDERSISSGQRKLLYGLFRDISEYTGYDVEEAKESMKIEFMLDRDIDYFSLSNVEIQTAREFIEYLLEFMFKWDIPINEKVVPLAKRENNYFYLCLMYRKCAVCGTKGAHVHHVDAVGSGRNRNEVDHTQLRLITLCGEHHSETHNIGWLTFKKKYIVEGIKLTKESLVKMKLMKKGEITPLIEGEEL